MHIQEELRQNAALATMAAVIALWSGTGLPAQAQKLVTFDAPNASTAAYAGTEAAAINNRGAITGDVQDANGGVHGYVRSAEGDYVEFDVSGANSAPGANCLYYAGGTCPQAINDLGVITGFYGDASGAFHGFVRNAGGEISTFDAPGAAGATFATSINVWGTITGYSFDEAGTGHGFVRKSDGTITMFDDSEGGTGPGLGTFPDTINDEGAIAGVVADPAGFNHGFVRGPEGKVANFDPPGATTSPIGTGNVLINDLGLVAGTVFRGASNVNYGFEGAWGRKLLDFETEQAGTGSNEGTNVNAMNVFGTTVGYVTDSNEENHTFVRYANGKAVVFDVPGQMAVPGSFFGSAAYGINARGLVAGRWHDTNTLLHAFVWVP
ncbi:hypothetical protein P8935_15160 [Telmatobacter sp. DSM 110680]|uniref:HAF repeat-containing protein n=1 Tax=Telmatobacter sp. DSM 110680 TaxID=3036704 RepID=A0AAU7DFP1_9BACT